MIRSFVALPLDDAVRDAVAQAVQRLREAERGTGRAVAWVPAQNLHLTLKFLGQQPDERLAAVRAALSEVARACRPFSLDLKGVGAFPALDRPRILWVGLNEGGVEARALQEQVEAALEHHGFPREDRQWHPHLTIGRIPDDRRWRAEAGPALREGMAAIATQSFGRLPVDRVVLMRSDLGPGGARYRELASAALAG